jgi:hypothetical protein
LAAAPPPVLLSLRDSQKPAQARCVDAIGTALTRTGRGL